MVITGNLMAHRRPRSQQIFPAETVAGFIAPLIGQERLAHQDLLWFVVNEAACASLIRGTSGQEDVCQITYAAHLLTHHMSARAWFEWIDSKSNPADGLSRDGVYDTWTMSQHWQVGEYELHLPT